MLMNNEFKADTSTGNPTGNSRWDKLASRALNMSCSFGQSARSIESSAWLYPHYLHIYMYWFHHLGMIKQGQIDGLVQERRNSIDNALQLRLSCTNPWRWAAYQDVETSPNQ